MSELFTLPQHVLDAAALRARLKIRGHAGQPGAGPAGETCRSCAHYTQNSGRTAKVYRKCGLMRAHWTGGPGSDVKAGDPACPKWAQRFDDNATRALR